MSKAHAPLDEEELEFEDESGDESEDEEMMMDGEDEDDEGGAGSSNGPHDGVRADVAGKLWRAGDAIEADEQLDFDRTAYEMLHRMNYEWPCLTFGVAHDNLGDQRTTYPHTAYVVAGTQADRASQNKLLVMKLSQLHRMKNDDDGSSSEEDSDVEDDEDPVLDTQQVAHQGTVNRLKLMPQASHICAAWSDTPEVRVWDLSRQLASLHAEGSARAAGETVPLQSFAGHTEEGFALDWSPVQQGALASGDGAHRIHVWAPTSAATWAVDPQPYLGHTGSVEDIAWSPVEAAVMLSCGCDTTLRVWDTRKKSGSAISVDEGHGEDINVISWNRLVNYLVVSGADDGSFRIWDLRSFRNGLPVAKFDWHKAAITSVEWSPQESSTLAVSGADHQLTLWDLALEDDPDADTAMRGRDDLKDIPPQLYFVHQGQKDIKELHWHKQLPGVLASTASDSFHIFKPANAGDGAATAAT